MTAPEHDPLSSAHAWLHAAASELGIDPEITRELIGDILDLTRDVAHGPSRPAAPVTAFLVGLSAGRASGDTPTEVRDRIAQLTTLLREDQ
ncbi:MAG: DUF6457 domain-containing protein [Corynebacterium sp.]|uniref:DUF6457 domain-containing protein n=1 Tax=Corynebacterium sp. TaxID=1720 RepID=UPI0026DFD6E1|nr:DUF6457 domain-containing protein [Corynebacterium sp.]MDO5670265.1 DUF6457 domain-containing protein [Corynebacterium sp.]